MGNGTRKQQSLKQSLLSCLRIRAIPGKNTQLENPVVQFKKVITLNLLTLQRHNTAQIPDADAAAGISFEACHTTKASTFRKHSSFHPQSRCQIPFPDKEGQAIGLKEMLQRRLDW